MMSAGVPGESPPRGGEITMTHSSDTRCKAKLMTFYLTKRMCQNPFQKAKPRGKVLSGELAFEIQG